MKNKLDCCGHGSLLKLGLRETGQWQTDVDFPSVFWLLSGLGLFALSPALSVLHLLQLMF